MSKPLLLSVAVLVVVFGAVWAIDRSFPKKSPTNSSMSQVKTFTYTLAYKARTSGPDTITVNQGDQVRISVTADKDWPELHIHGYELKQPIKANQPTVISFTADKTGSFKVEAHFVEKTRPDDTSTPADSNNPDEMSLTTLQVYPK
jgi:heme/copper-type cytochrome/quinol oxidase subunit 2